MKKRLLLIVSLLFLGGPGWAQKLTVSVMDLNVTEGLSGKEVMMLTDKLLNEFVSAGTYKVVERSKRDEILKELGFQQSGACDQGACLVEAGQLLGVQKMFGGTIGKMGNVFAVELRMMDVKTGEIDMAFSRQYTGDVSALLGAMREAAAEFSKWTPKSQVTSTRLKVEYGSIKVLSKPNGAKIRIDGSEVGETPAQLDKIEVGECQISLIKSGYQQYDTTVTVDKIKTASINAALFKITQTVAASPAPQASPAQGEGRGAVINPSDGSLLRSKNEVLNYDPSRVIQAGSRLSLAVFPFDNRSGNAEITNTVQDKMITSLYSLKRFKLLVRSEIDRVLREQKLGMTGDRAIDPDKAVKVGKILGVDAILIGSIFSTENGVGIDARLIDPETGTIITAKDAFSNRTSLQDIKNMAQDIAIQIYNDVPLVEGYVIKVDPTQIILDVGSNKGMRKGMKMVVYKEGEDIKHPVTGQVLDKQVIKVGELLLTKVQEKMSEAQILKKEDGQTLIVGQKVVAK